MRRTTLIAAFAAIFAISGAAIAQPQAQPQQTKKTPVINHRQVKQQRRIAQGVRSGKLTKGETRRLERQQARIQRTKRRDKMMNGGKLTPKEKTHINKMQNRANKRIYRAKHNKKVRH
jgi:aminoglycoside phosphotransferase family enzyme